MKNFADDRKPRAAAPDPGRRSLLKLAPLAGAAALTAGRAGAAAGPTADEPEPEDRHQPVYRVTEHVKAYYARARG